MGNGREMNWLTVCRLSGEDGGSGSVEGDGEGRETREKGVGGVCRGEKREQVSGMAGFREREKGNRGASLVLV